MYDLTKSSVKIETQKNYFDNFSFRTIMKSDEEFV